MNIAHTGLTPAQVGILSHMAKPSVYCMNLPFSVDRQPLIDRELIEWVPGQTWSGNHTYAITEKGRALVKELFGV